MPLASFNVEPEVYFEGSLQARVEMKNGATYTINEHKSSCTFCLDFMNFQVSVTTSDRQKFVLRSDRLGHGWKVHRNSEKGEMVLFGGADRHGVDFEFWPSSMKKEIPGAPWATIKKVPEDQWDRLAPGHSRKRFDVRTKAGVDTALALCLTYAIGAQEDQPEKGTHSGGGNGGGR